MKKTKWYPAGVKPARKGVYQVDDGIDIGKALSYFDGKGFCFRIFNESKEYFNEDVDLAYACRKNYTVLPTQVKWRGLARNPE